MASRIPEDTLRRCKYPVIRHTNPDGSVSYEREIVSDATMISSMSKDFSPKAAPKEPSRPRDSKGRFSK